MTLSGAQSVIVACPDSRPPAYQAVVGLDRANLLHSFRTGFYYRDRRAISQLGIVAPKTAERLERALRRRFDAEISAERVESCWSYDIALQLEKRLARYSRRLRRSVARVRTEAFDKALAASIDKAVPGALLVFSDVGSRETLPRCRSLGIPCVLSMVHGEVHEELQVLAAEAEISPEFFGLYLGEGTLDRVELDWLHARRLAELHLADHVLVPSEHIADQLVRNGTPRKKISVVPYAADTRRFRPDFTKKHGSDCTFLFAGGVTQRKGIRYLLEAWRRVRRPGWRLQLLGALPRDPGPLTAYLDEVEVLGRVPHAEVPAVMAAAEVFVFPSLFEGSAVVTYEALACGLPSVVTPSAGAVVRDGLEGFVIPPRDIETLAERMELLGIDGELRAQMSVSARARAEEFDWPRYHRSTVEAITSVVSGRAAKWTRSGVLV